YFIHDSLDIIICRQSRASWEYLVHHAVASEQHFPDPAHDDAAGQAALATFYEVNKYLNLAATSSSAWPQGLPDLVLRATWRCAPGAFPDGQPGPAGRHDPDVLLAPARPTSVRRPPPARTTKKYLID
ncbi:putative TLC domain-containing protein, partial [Naja naja]